MTLSIKTEAIPIWRRIQRNNFTKIDCLLDFLEMAPENRDKLLARPRFPLNLPQRLASKMEKNRLDDPIFRQFVPLVDEQMETAGFALDPVQDQIFRKSKKLLHKYEGRALLITTSACAMHCRYCFRQNFPYETEEKSFEEEIAHLKNHPNLSEIILSGGDPLSLSDGNLANLLTSLNDISHLKRIRFHTRFPIGIPERIDNSFLGILSSSSKQIFFVVHTNHPKELDSDVIAALKKIQQLGIPTLNQSVLLKGVNDDETTLLDLSEALVNAGVIPYYLHCLDPVQGSAHFAVPAQRRVELVRHVQIHLSGFGVPRLAQEDAGQPSKTFMTD